MKWEVPLISRIVDTGDFKTARGLTADSFFSPEGRQAWNYIREFVVLHNVTPSRELLEENVAGFEFALTSDPVAALVERVHDFSIYNRLNIAAEKVAELATSSTMEAARYFAEEGMRMRTLIGGANVTATDITQQVEEEKARYYMRKNLKGVLGIPWPWERLNKATFGIRDGNLCVFYARPKNMKTWLLLYVAYYCHYLGRRIYMATREMTKEELQQRYCAIWSEVDYHRYARGQLTTMEEKRWLEAMEAFQESPPFMIDQQIPGVGEEAADTIIGRAQDYGADLLAVDGIYFFGNREWEQIAAFTSRIKYHLLNTHKIPCVGTTQGARSFGMGKTSKKNPDDVGYGDSILQDADVLIKCSYVEEDGRVYLSLPAIREGRFCEFQVNAKPGADFKQAFVTDDENEDGFAEKGSVKEITAEGSEEDE